jgi:hypothetical protein
MVAFDSLVGSLFSRSIMLIKAGKCFRIRRVPFFELMDSDLVECTGTDLDPT